MKLEKETYRDSSHGWDDGEDRPNESFAVPPAHKRGEDEND